MFLGKPRNARQGFPPALKILGIRLCGPAGIETRFREQRGQQRQAPLLEMRGLSKTVGFLYITLLFYILWGNITNYMSISDFRGRIGDEVA